LTTNFEARRFSGARTLDIAGGANNSSKSLVMLRKHLTTAITPRANLARAMRRLALGATSGQITFRGSTITHPLLGNTPLAKLRKSA
jgi:hypothetical protein